MFERLQDLLQQMKSRLGEGALLLTEESLSQSATAPESETQRFAVLLSLRFSVLLVGEPQESESVAEYDAQSRLYQVGLTFEPRAIASFLTQLSHRASHHRMALNKLHQSQTRLRTNDPTLQTEFTLSLLEILASAETSDSADCPVAVCQPLVEEALCQQIEQERLLNQVTTQIRQSLELPVILETAVEQLRHFLQVDRLLIYQFDQFNCVSAIYQDDISSTQDKTASLNLRLTSQGPLLNSTVYWGRVTYEARSSDAISSVLNFVEKEDCLLKVPNCRTKYGQGLTLSIDDVEAAYPASSCILDLMRRYQVRAKLVTPIIVQEKLWGLLIANQCFQPRHWLESEKIFLQQIAEHLAVAIHQAQLYAQLQQQKTTLERRVIERTQELRDILQAAQAADRAKSEFLATMSHELRTPLTCVIGMSATLLRWSFGQEGTQQVPLQKQRRYLKTIQESGEHLLELINDILDLSQVEAGKAVLNISEFSLSNLAHQTIRTFQEKADLRQLKLGIDLQVKSHGMNGTLRQEDRFCADQRRVKQILFNLLGNAIKFTPSGGKVILRIWREQNWVVFQVEDTGIGIAEEHLPLLFQKFQQLETVYQRNYEGTGLGLALTKQLVELHGGRIEVESVVGEGSYFTVWLPNQPLASSTSSKDAALQKNNFIVQGSIVLVEDQEESATSICEILTAAGYHVVWLMDGSTAFQQIELLQPNAVIVDWQLRGMDGYEITHCLRNSPSTQQIKILALTMSTITEDQEDELSAFIDDYLLKPVEPVQLLQQVTALMAK
jgi:two-component system sensor histidine kinase/response regulator